MDADLIRLILLILGVCLIAGIWLWDRWQRSHGEPPMVRLREQDAIEEPEADEPEPEPGFQVEVEHPDDAAEPALDRPVLLDPDDLEAPLESRRQIESVPSDTEPEPESVQLNREPAWVRPAEPVIPAFLIAADSDLSEAEPAPAAPAAEALAEPEAESMPEPAAVAEAAEPSLILDDDGEPELPVLELAPEPIDAPARPVRAKAQEPAAKAKSGAEPVSIRMDEDQFDLDLGFSAVDDTDLQEVAVDLPDLIVQINIVAKGEPFSGEQVLAAMDQVEMRAGEHDIFHRYDNRAVKGHKPKSLFSLASLVEPGSFPLKKMKDFSTPGLTLFAQLPGPRDGLLIYSDMLYVAERLARLLDARLKDERRSTLTKQTIEHTRERIAEHKRQITLKLRQAGDTHKGRR